MGVVTVLCSMTGHGEFSQQCGALLCVAEVRSVNNRHLKVVLRADESLLAMEAEVEKVARDTVRRGTLMISLKSRRQDGSNGPVIDAQILRNYIQQIRSAAHLDSSGEILVAACLALPGVAQTGAVSSQEDLEKNWPVWESTIRGALAKMQSMRLREGEAMAQELTSLHDAIRQETKAIADRSPEVVKLHREKLRSRLEVAFAQSGLEKRVEPHEVLREAALLAERLDIGEEIVRLGSHLTQFTRFMKQDESTGRKLDFLLQEMLRETNTIGSKASDLEIAHRVVEIKAYLERIRELVQNVE